MKQSAHSRIATIITRLKPGTIIFPSDFREAGTHIAIKNALSRLAKENKIERLAHGIYLLPQNDPKFGKLYPSLEKIADTIASREHVTIKPAGAYALHRLGLSTQVPMKQVYITNGSPKRIRVGKGTIEFKATTARKLALQGPISSLIIQALSEYDQNELENDITLRKRIHELLLKEEPKFLKRDIKLAPAKVSDYLYKLMHQTNLNDDRMAS